MTPAMVVRHVDGDMVWAYMPTPSEGIASHERVRFIGVDTPETVHPKQLVEYFDKEASEFTKERLLYNIVYMAFDWP